MTIFLVLSLAIAGAATPEPNALSGDVQGAGQQVLADAASLAPRPASADAPPARDRQVCRRQLRIGTLAGFERVCHTQAEWQAIARGSQASWQQIQGTLGSTHSREGGGGACLPSGVGC